MNTKRGVPFGFIVGIVVIFIVCVAAFWIVAYNGEPSMKEHNFSDFSPWFCLIPFFIILMIAMGIFCCKQRWGGMCKPGEWGQWFEQHKQPGGQGPVDILKIRLAKGEISEVEYDRLIEKISRESQDEK